MCCSQLFPIKLLTLCILFSTAVRAVVVVRLVILGILFLTSFILALKAVIVPKLVILSILSILALRVSVAKLVISVTLSSIYFISSLTLFFTTSPSLL